MLYLELLSNMLDYDDEISSICNTNIIFNFLIYPRGGKY